MGWIRHGSLLRPLFLALILTLVSFLSIKLVYDPGARPAAAAKIKWQPRQQLMIAEEFAATGEDLTLRHRFSSYDEYLQLQLRKTSDAKLRKIWTSRDWRRKVDAFGAIFRRLIQRDLLRRESKALCIGARVGQEVLALRENGVVDSTGIDLVPAPPLVIRGDIHSHPFPSDTFDFEFSNVFDHALLPSRFVSEIERTLKPGGIAVIHAIIHARGDNFSANQLRSLDPLVALFERSEVVEVRAVDAFGLDTELVMRKRPIQPSSCTPKISRHTMRLAEPLIVQEPAKPWIVLKRNVAKIQYLPRLLDTSDFHGRSRHVYVDVGARTYGSSIGGWFKKAYPTYGRNFTVYAIEADAAFHAGYAKRRDVTLLPYAAWTRNETLMFGTAGDDSMGRIQSASSSAPRRTSTSVQGFDFAAWLADTVAPSDYVVMKMDVEGTEFELLPRLIESGAICLVDELFLECHYNRWQKCCPGERSAKYNRTYTQCLALFQSLRASGVLAHQWW
ncbi:uncharacterized protein LOC9636243 [Selaginella moellendorffii]|nr:uncharacterized protein LOC9636243 [Selaginella moellendorffii]|eukprot:XP_024543086.1 uncharacterized protein LOC9636243 [Selaginella moellendorffii]